MTLHYIRTAKMREYRRKALGLTDSISTIADSYVGGMVLMRGCEPKPTQQTRDLYFRIPDSMDVQEQMDFQTKEVTKFRRSLGFSCCVAYLMSDIHWLQDGYIERTMRVDLS
jgi:hypothetical protein